VHVNLSGASHGDLGRRNCDLEPLRIYDDGGQRCSVPYENRRRIKVAAIDGKQNALCYLSQSRGVRYKRSDHRFRPGAPAERVVSATTSETEDGEQKNKRRSAELIWVHDLSLGQQD